MELATVTTTKGETRIDSRLVAQYLGIKPFNLVEQIKDHKTAFEQLGIIRFQTGLITKKGRPEKFALLNEDQAFLALTFRRNSPKIVSMKVGLVKAFSEARRAADIRKTEYLPQYRDLHNAIKAKSNGSPNERFLHMNANKEVNRLVGIQSGQRAGAGALTQSLLTVLILAGCGDSVGPALTRRGRHSGGWRC